ncbi:hypothetical protein EYF80_019892 [Liparis tanakae]|uniref:Uncharacterized protein n=1 Tax=Liparis tanakae TaxID=230148 RepID=A0A4Z2HXS6_9TELE|nr:hypothetical protein EYF80_019892 [Liparis tanakae]
MAECRVLSHSLACSSSPRRTEPSSMLRFMSSRLSTLYVRGLKERSEVAVASMLLRPCQLWSAVLGKDEEEEEEVEDSHRRVPIASLSVAFRLGGRSREESILLLCSQSHVGWAG